MSEERHWASGIGYDIHRFELGRRLVLGGVIIPDEMGLAGHSDADVLTHAIMDALLGAAGQPDIGDLFPNDDPIYKDANSLILLKQVVDLIHSTGWQIGNVDTVVLAERPRISIYRQSMRENLAAVLGLEIAAIGIKATTNEGLGAIGRGEGIAALATTQLWGVTTT